MRCTGRCCLLERMIQMTSLSVTVIDVTRQCPAQAVLTPSSCVDFIEARDRQQLTASRQRASLCGDVASVVDRSKQPTHGFARTLRGSGKPMMQGRRERRRGLPPDVSRDPGRLRRARGGDVSGGPRGGVRLERCRSRHDSERAHTFSRSFACGLIQTLLSLLEYC